VSAPALPTGPDAIGDRVRAILGPAIEPIAAASALLAADPAAGAAEDEIGRIGAAALQLRQMVAEARLGIDADNDAEAACSRLRHDLRTPLVALKGYGELLQEIAGEDGLDGIVGATRQLLEGVAEVMVAIERAVPAHSRALAAESDPETSHHAAVAGRILVADDSLANRDILVQYLSREGHEVMAVPDGLSAIEAVFDHPFDVVLLDMIMPGMNGDEVLKTIKAEPRLKALPVIMISALDAFDSIVRCIEMGAEDYLPKPFNRVLLRARISACLEKKRLREIELAYLSAIEKELGIAHGVQQSILPKTFPPHVALAGHGLMVPARDIGGDFYDFFALDNNRIGLVVGDVSGKGVPAAVYMAMVRTQLRATALFGLSPAQCLYRLNEDLSAENPSGMFVSLFYGIVDCESGTFTYANGGHNWPIICRANGATEWLAGTDDLLVGVLYGSAYHDATLPLAPGDSILVYTDGVVEAIAPSEEEFGRHRLEAVIGRQANSQPAALAGAVLAAVRTFEAGQPPSDDLTCVAVRYLGGPTNHSRFELRVANTFAEIGRLIDALETYFRRGEIDAEIGRRLTIAIEEVVSNVIRHGHDSGERGARAITVRITPDDNALTAEIIDDGAPFDPTAISGGPQHIGLQLIMSMVDGMAYSRQDDCNHLRITKTLS